MEIRCDDEVDAPLKRYESKDYSNLNLMPNVWKAVFYKKYVFIKREWKYFLFMVSEFGIFKRTSISKPCA